MEQARRQLDESFARLEQLEASAAAVAEQEVARERARNREQHEAEQARLDSQRRALASGDTEAVLDAVGGALGDVVAPLHVVVDNSYRLSVGLVWPAVSELVPSQMVAVTNAGNETLRSRTKTSANALYVEALAAYVVSIARNSFAAAPTIREVELLVARAAGDELQCLYVGVFTRQGNLAWSSGNMLSAAQDAARVAFRFRGRVRELVAVELAQNGELADRLRRICERVELGRR